jgi:hypothetical protein
MDNQSLEQRAEAWVRAVKKAEEKIKAEEMEKIKAEDEMKKIKAEEEIEKKHMKENKFGMKENNFGRSSKFDTYFNNHNPNPKIKAEEMEKIIKKECEKIEYQREQMKNEEELLKEERDTYRKNKAEERYKMSIIRLNGIEKESINCGDTQSGTLNKLNNCRAGIALNEGIIKRAELKEDKRIKEAQKWRDKRIKLEAMHKRNEIIRANMTDAEKLTLEVEKKKKREREGEILSERRRRTDC